LSQESPTPGGKRFVRPLPAFPNLDKQRKFAKALARDYWRGTAGAIERVQALHPKPPAPDDFRLSDAQLVIARGYGFTNWAELKKKIDSLTKSPAELFKAAVEAGDTEELRRLLESHPELASKINEPMFSFDSSAVHVARTNVALLDLLLAHGGDLNARTGWEKGGFGVLEQVSPEEAAPLIARGARVDVWAAANLGMIAELRDIIARDPSLVHAKGGDGKRPLHFSRTVEIARFLLDQGAEIDALDDDHSSTPAQHLIGDRPEVAAFLIAHGAKSDLLLAAALGDIALIERHLDADPRAIGMRVDQDWFPMIDTAPNGGHIYQWTLGFHISAFDVARGRGWSDALNLLLKRAAPRERLLDALWCGDQMSADAILAANPKLREQVVQSAARHLADAARNNNAVAVKAMLACGFPLTAKGQHGAMPLHWAAFHGNPEMMAEVLQYHPQIEAQDDEYHGTAMGWLIHGALGPWGYSTKRHDACARILLSAGSKVDEAALPTGHDGIDQVLREHFMRT
jgi:ankyrin repeat protein